MTLLPCTPVDMGPRPSELARAREKHLNYCTKCGPLGDCDRWKGIEARHNARQEGAE